MHHSIRFLHVRLLGAALFLLSGSPALFAQAQVGYTGSNYAGYNAITFNPALLAQTPYALDIHVVSVQAGFDNDFLGLRNDGFFGTKTLNASYDDFDDFRDRALIVNFDGANGGQVANFRLGLDVLGPGALIPLSPRSALSIGTRYRSMINVEQLGAEAARLALDGFEFPPLWGQDFESDGVRLGAMFWAEYMVSYAHRLYQNEEKTHYLAGGATVKLLQGTQGMYLYSDDLNYRFTNDDIMTLTQSNLYYGHSEGFALNDPLRNFRFDDLGIGADLGLVYEWRPEGEAYNGKAGQKPAATDRSATRYKLKAAVALTDIGSIAFSRNPKAFDRPEGSVDIEDWDITEVSIDGVVAFDDTLIGRFPQGQQTAPRSFRMTMPRTLTAMLDYHVVEGFYVGLNAWWSPRSPDDATRVRNTNRLALNPRYEMRWFGAGVPVSYQELNGLDAGLYLRLGPVILGSANIFTNAFGAEVSGADVYLSLRVPLLHGRRVESTETGEYNSY